MRVTVLGCGTSTGVPIVGCDCKVCRSDDPRNRRLRASIVIHLDSGENLLVDTSPDMREQALRAGLRRIDAVFYTHVHADHTHGIDEIRTFNYLQKAPIDIYSAAEYIEHIQRQFAYIFQPSIQRGGGKPDIVPHVIVPGQAFELFGQEIVPLETWHGKLLSVAWRVGGFAYLTDVNRVPDETIARLKGLDVLILDALRWGTHPTHYTIEQAVELAGRIGARRTWLTHMGHEVDFGEAEAFLRGTTVGPALDGMCIDVERATVCEFHE